MVLISSWKESAICEVHKKTNIYIFEHFEMWFFQLLGNKAVRNIHIRKTKFKAN